MYFCASEFFLAFPISFDTSIMTDDFVCFVFLFLFFIEEPNIGKTADKVLFSVRRRKEARKDV